MQIQPRKIDALLARAVAKHQVPGVVAIVADARGVQFLEAHGYSDTTQGIPLKIDAFFRIASLTKAAVAVAVLQLVERGELDLDAPVGSIIPAFDDLPVLEGFDGDTPRLRPARRRATLRHLMTHTSGQPYDAFSEDLVRFGSATGIPMPSSGLKRSFLTPLTSDPGDRFGYGMSTDWTGQVLEIVSGATLDVVLRRSVFEPLGITDLVFSLDDSRRPRLVPVQLRFADGGFKTIDFDWPSDPEFYSAGHGLYGTASAYMQLQRALLRGGELDGVRLLRPDTFELMVQDQLGDVSIERLRSARPEFTYDLDLGPNTSWGLDTMITVEAEPGMRSSGSFGWCGSFNTFYWIDRARDMTAALHMQCIPFLHPDVIDLYREFERTLYTPD